MGGMFVLPLTLGESKSTFNMEKAVCNHGFFMMAPNKWNPSNQTLERPLRLADGTASVNVSISHSPLHPHLLYIRMLLQSPSQSDQNAILEQVTRMLRITERDERDVREFQKIHPQAKEKGFGRIFRSPSLFEDVVKSILLCNSTWNRTLKMAEALCKLQHELMTENVHGVKSTTTGNKGIKRKRANTKPRRAKFESESQIMGNFPNARELASLDESYFWEKCVPLLGYRAKYILKLAKDFESGKLIWLGEMEKATEEKTILYHEKMIMKNIDGFGHFACANVLMCMRYYEKVPADSETIRHLQQVHGRTCNKSTIQKEVKKIYDKYAPFQCLAYWMELLEYYENKFGKLSQLPASSYQNISGSRV